MFLILTSLKIEEARIQRKLERDRQTNLINKSNLEIIKGQILLNCENVLKDFNLKIKEANDTISTWGIRFANTDGNDLPQKSEEMEKLQAEAIKYKAIMNDVKLKLDDSDRDLGRIEKDESSEMLLVTIVSDAKKEIGHVISECDNCILRCNSKEKSKEQDSSGNQEAKSMVERRKSLERIKRVLECPIDCNDKHCKLRSQVLLTKGCKCQVTELNCFFCYRHVCEECVDNVDKLKAGMRKCKAGTCVDRPEDWEKSSISSSSSKENKSKPRVANTRCGHCHECRESCELLNRKTCDWCDICIKKKNGEGTGNRGCKKRSPCVVGAKAEKAPGKRKPVESPPEKKEPKKVNHDSVGSDGKNDSKLSK